MYEVNPEFRSAEEWAAKYHPVKNGSGIRDCAGRTLFDPFGEDRQYVGRMDDVFVWAVLNNGYFDYIQHGFSGDAIGYLVSDNPVRFADAETKFVIGYEQIDWETFARLQESEATPGPEDYPEELASEDPIDKPDEEVEDDTLSDLGAAEPEEEDSGEAVDADVFVESAAADDSAVAEDTTDGTVEPVADDPNERMGADGSAQDENVLAANSVEPEQIEAVHDPDVPASQSDVPVADSSAHVASGSDDAEAAEAAGFEPDVYVGEMPAAEAQPVDENPSEEGLPEAAGIPTRAEEVSEYLDAEDSTSFAEDVGTEWPPEPVAQEQPVAMRQLPIGHENAQADIERFGSWPDAVMCKPCRGTGWFAGIEMCGIGCKECDERGWNPTPGTPHEIPVYA